MVFGWIWRNKSVLGYTRLPTSFAFLATVLLDGLICVHEKESKSTRKVRLYYLEARTLVLSVTTIHHDHTGKYILEAANVIKENKWE